MYIYWYNYINISFKPPYLSKGVNLLNLSETLPYFVHAMDLRIFA